MHEESNLNRSICWYWGFIDLCLPLKTVLRKVERGSPKPGDEGVQTTHASINCNAMVKRVWSSEQWQRKKSPRGHSAVLIMCCWFHPTQLSPALGCWYLAHISDRFYPGWINQKLNDRNNHVTTRYYNLNSQAYRISMYYTHPYVCMHFLNLVYFQNNIWKLNFFIVSKYMIW